MTLSIAQDLAEVLSDLSAQYPVAGSSTVLVVFVIAVTVVRPIALECMRMRTCRALVVACPPGSLLARVCGRDRMLVVAAPLGIGPSAVLAHLSRRPATS